MGFRFSLKKIRGEMKDWLPGMLFQTNLGLGMILGKEVIEGEIEHTEYTVYFISRGAVYNIPAWYLNYSKAIQ